MSGPWRASMRDSVTCNPCLALYGLRLKEASDGAINGAVALVFTFKHDATSGAGRVHGVRRGDTVDVVFLPTVADEVHQTRAGGIKGVLAPDGSSIHGEVWFTLPDSISREYRRPIILVRAELDSALLAILSEAKLR